MLTIPLFPLNLVILPYEYLPLHIFEPRYKTMIKNSIEEDTPFGIILSQDDEMYSKGCRVKVTEVYKKYHTGEYDILVKGVERFKVFDTKKDGETVIGEIEYIPLIQNQDNALIDLLQDSYLRVLLKLGINTDLELHMKKKISYEFVQGFELPLQIKKKLISIDNENKRLHFINNIFENILSSELKIKNSDLPEA
ncbi:MAG: hypothetical protein CMG55_05815 [Candidatus Marinimicrobia bacterium]|nr:hypothetical protein [Candidatus Neomarinimicrobiota bacterium]|tara:strand:- start:1050 stop:1634 length:585 start_codon:yes stop_codon:yes gene_type:complete